MSKAKIFLACCVWLVLLGIGVSVYRLWFVPRREQQAEQQQEQIIDSTSGSSSYRMTLSMGVDAFSGYSVLRSPEMRNELRLKGIKLELVDDAANYEQRLSALESGKLQMAAFPVDALLKASADLESLPATIVAIVDETNGADAIVAYKEKFPNVDALNNANTRFLLVGDSPSETLARHVMQTFDSTFLTPDSLVQLPDEKALMDRYLESDANGNDVFVTWEPLVSQMVGGGQRMHVLYSTATPRGIIVDALVVSRGFLLDQPSIVQDVVESYFRARYAYRSDAKLAELVVADAKANGTQLSGEQAKKLVSGIIWKNTQDNFAHFGLRRSTVSHIEDVVDRIKRLLLDTGALTRDPTQGDSTMLFYDKTMLAIQSQGFHPGSVEEQVSETAQLQSLSDSQWARLEPIGKVGVPPLIFAPSRADLTEPSKTKLDDLIETLETFPRAYLMIQGNAGTRGDLEQNKRLAKQRAEAALQYLGEKGVPEVKMRAVDGELSGRTSVSFVLAELPY